MIFYISHILQSNCIIIDKMTNSFYQTIANRF
ncbi:Hypothetical protein EIN_193060, partial [Entamoeba invadens IP1]